MNEIAESKTLEILLVEDSPSDALLTKEALGSSSAVKTIHHVENGDEAMEFLHGQGAYVDAPRPDLVLLDLNLPRKSGLEVLQEIKADKRLKTIPVVILTTSRDEADVLGSYGQHANCYVSKPVAFESLVQVVGNIQKFWSGVATLPPNGTK
ncbi:response regulator [bacterium]|nr:response regulator [bacterium]